MLSRAITVYRKLRLRRAQFKMHSLKVGFKCSISGHAKNILTNGEGSKSKLEKIA